MECLYLVLEPQVLHMSDGVSLFGYICPLFSTRVYLADASCRGFTISTSSCLEKQRSKKVQISGRISYETTSTR